MMWSKVLISYLFAELVLVALAVGATLWFRQRRKQQRQQGVPNGYVLTDEVFTDPTTGVVQRVWFNPETGERFYQAVRQDAPHSRRTDSEPTDSGPTDSD
jgi:hypothetical protein